jgi:DNA-binding IscR family transcriptional regulator
MKLSTRGRYALRAMIDLAQVQCNNLKPISLRDISLRQEISLQYLEQLFNKLKRANLVKSIRGRKSKKNTSKKCKKIEDCAIRVLLEEITQRINQTLDATSLKDLCKIAQKIKEG